MKTRSLQQVAQKIRSGEITRVSFLTGAGVSVASDIPDFRSPGGMYDTLRPELMTASEEERRWMAEDPTSCVSWRVFRRNQLVYLELRRAFMLGLSSGRWKPSAFHFLQHLVHKHGALHRIYSQNIDGLEFACAADDVSFYDKILNVHGAIAAPPKCEFCGASDLSRAQWEAALRANIKDIYGEDKQAPLHSTPIPCPSCGENGLKPPTVLYGRQLPREFFDSIREDLPSCQLLIVAGSSLTVGPANSIPSLVPDDCHLVLANIERVPDSVIDYERALFFKGYCDVFAIELCRQLGWLDELAACIPNMAPNSARAVREALVAE